jgi:hypothetical protein
MAMTRELLRSGAQLLQPVAVRLGATRPRVFISYRRRGDGGGYGGRIAERLMAHFGAESCFRDVDSIESGEDFVRAISHAVRSCKALIVVIGPDWLTQQTPQGRRRLDDPDDFVRNELYAGLRADVRIIPVLVGGASMPSATQLPESIKALARRHAQELTEARWNYDMGRLIATLEAIGISNRPTSWLPSLSRRAWLAVSGIAATTLTVVTAAALYAYGVPPPPHHIVPLPPPPIFQPDAGALAGPPKEPDNEIAPKGPTTVPGSGHRPSGSKAARLPAKNVADTPATNAAGRWQVRWTDPSGSYDGQLKLTGNNGKLRVRYSGPNGQIIVIDQAIYMRQEGADTVLQGVGPVVASTGAPATFYQPDHAHVRLGPDGLLHAAFCDLANGHLCYPALITALPAVGAALAPSSTAF